MMKKSFGFLLLGILAGLSIGIGCIANLAAQNKVVGAVLFSVGLYLVLVNGFSLFTGMVCYIPKEGAKYIVSVLFAIVGNFIGATLAGFAIRATRLTAVIEKANILVSVKADDSLLSIFILAIFCNFMIFFAVDSFKNNKHEFGKYLGTLLCIPVFILCGYEHCVANMCYLALANCYTKASILMLLVAIAGNAVGGILIYLLKDFANKLKADKSKSDSKSQNSEVSA